MGEIVPSAPSGDTPDILDRVFPADQLEPETERHAHLTQEVMRLYTPEDMTDRERLLWRRRTRAERALQMRHGRQ